MSEVLIKYGNHWLMTDNIQTKIEWVSDRATASRHTREWADQFKKATGFRIDVYTPEEAQAEADKARERSLRSAYFYAVEAEVRRLAPNTDYYIPGVGCASYCFAVDPGFAAGIPATKTAADFVATHKGRKIKRTGSKV